MTDLRLHDYAASANCYKVRLLLAQLALDYERVTVDIFAGDTLDNDYARRNPDARDARARGGGALPAGVRRHSRLPRRRHRPPPGGAVGAGARRALAAVRADPGDGHHRGAAVPSAHRPA